MQHYIYSWRLHPREGVEVELRIEAANAVAARREAAVVLSEHESLGFVLESVHRSSLASRRPQPVIVLEAPRGRRSH